MCHRSPKPLAYELLGDKKHHKEFEATFAAERAAGRASWKGTGCWRPKAAAAVPSAASAACRSMAGLLGSSSPGTALHRAEAASAGALPAASLRMQHKTVISKAYFHAAPADELEGSGCN